MLIQTDSGLFGYVRTADSSQPDFVIDHYDEQQEDKIVDAITIYPAEQLHKGNTAPLHSSYMLHQHFDSLSTCCHNILPSVVPRLTPITFIVSEDDLIEQGNSSK
jgi:hypothetical protein